MIKHEDNCVQCDLPCLGKSCPNKTSSIYICDKCNNEINRIAYKVDGNDLCEDCFKDFVVENIQDILSELGDVILKYLEAERVVLN